ncbi:MULTISPECIES: hypothetical protein [unclassified Variovorax]|uniref:hypothetical protein n=1 Tax=unclassified Variovorax TaxID=663243 RepID=UPI0021BAADCB|nr:hypothetical protein [Variovorax sp. CY25R-8]MCT8175709.1 hypothetical protein [Variovorax sp. CY25R-8]
MIGAGGWMGLVLAAGIGYAAWAAKRDGCEQRDVKALRIGSGLCLFAAAVVTALELLLAAN